MAENLQSFQNHVKNELQSLSTHIPHIWAIEGIYNENSKQILSYHLTEEEAKSKKPSDYTTWFCPNYEDSGTFKIVKLNINDVPLDKLMSLRI
jgi:hypothetical protein